MQWESGYLFRSKGGKCYHEIKNHMAYCRKAPNFKGEVFSDRPPAGLPLCKVCAKEKRSDPDNTRRTKFGGHETRSRASEHDMGELAIVAAARNALE